MKIKNKQSKWVKFLVVLVVLGILLVAFGYLISRRKSTTTIYQESPTAAVDNLPFVDNFATSSNWSIGWGNVQFKPNALLIENKKSTTGGAIFLKGFQPWTDYAFTVALNWNSADVITLYARYDNINNYESCGFSKSGARIIENVDGVGKQLFDGSDLVTTSTADLGIRVIQDKVECLLNGQVIAYAYSADPSLASGGIGLSAWSEQGATSITVQNAQASAYNTPQEYSELYDVIQATSSTQSASYLDDILDNQEVKQLPYNPTGFDGNAWTRGWGELSVASTSLNFGATTSTTGGGLFLTGSDLWTDYDVETTINFSKGASFGIIARATNDSNYVYCDFGGNSASIVLDDDGTDSTIDSAHSPNIVAGESYELGAQVYGDKVACSVAGQDVVSAVISQNEPTSGGIGLTSWDPTLGNSDIVLNSLNVMPLTTDTIQVPLPSPIIPPAPIPDIATSTNKLATTTPSSTPQLQIPYIESNFTNDINWQRMWGTMAIASSGFMDIEANASTTGASVILNNSESWNNYTFATTLDWTEGESFGLIARYVNDDNYAVCEFEQPPGGYVQIELRQYVNGNETIFSSGVDLDYSRSNGSEVNAYIEVQGTSETCSFDNHVVLSSRGYTLAAPFTGGIGFTTWDPTLNNSQIVVKNVTVKENY